MLVGLSGIVVGYLTPKIREFAIRKNVVDIPTQLHKTHSEPIPYLGGVGIAVGVTWVSYIFATIFAFDALSLLSGIVIPALILGLVGLIDDIFNLKPFPRFVAQSGTGVFIAILLIRSNTVGSPTGSDLIDGLVTTIFVVGLCNAINFFDNIDGGASGTVAISSFVLLFLSMQSVQYYLAAMAAVLAGSTLGFLWWNKSPARIYMGDAGSLFLGVVLASLLVRFEPSPINRFSSFAVPLLIVAVPILDSSVAIISRIIRGVSPFQGGRDHLSHRLMKMGLKKRSAVFVLWFLSGVFGALAIVLSFSPYALEVYVTTFSAFLWCLLFVFFMRVRILV